MTDLLSIHIEKIKKLEYQRRRWIILGLIFVLYLCLLGFNWNPNSPINVIFWIVSGATIATVSIVWWIWTMMLVNSILSSQVEEITILSEIVQEIKSVKDEINNLKSGK